LVKRDQLVQFGKTVRKFRKEKGISQEELADAAGLDRSYVGGIERGERNVSLLNIIKIAAGLRIPPARFLEGFVRGTRA